MARKVKTVESGDLTQLEVHAIQVNEYYKALRKAGFSVEMALAVLDCRGSYPDWIIPEPKDVPFTYEDDEDED